MYVYNCNSILTTEMNNKSDKEIIRAFTELTTDLKSRKINPGLHLMENESQIYFFMTMATMDIRYQLVTSGKYRANNADRAIQTFKNHFIVGLCSIYKGFHLQL